METKPLKLNKPQLRFLLSKKSSATSVWGRGTAKSSTIALLMDEIIKKMPRSCWAIVGRTYQQILTRTLPSTIESLERIGYIRNLHYFVGRKPPEGWRWQAPHQAPLKYDHFIIFFNGTGFHLVSQDGGGGSARGLNLDGAISDETLLMDKDKYDAEVSGTLRANKHRFGHLLLHRGHFHFTSMPYGDTGRWLLDQGKYLEESYDFVSLTNELIDLQLKFVDSRDKQHRLRLYQDILTIKQQLKFFPDKDGLLYSEANVFDNLENIPLAYLMEQRKVLTHFTFMTEILNKRPGTIEAGFYPMLEYKKHVYDRYNNDYLNGLEFNLKKLGEVDSRMDGDCESNLPLRIALDWGAKISTLSVAQRNNHEYRFLNALYVKHPKLVDDLADSFITYYRYHLTKTVYFIQDNEYGNQRILNSTVTYNDQFADRIRKAGWRVIPVDMGRVPGYQVRYHLAHEYLGESNPRLPIIRFNRHNCRDLLTAMTLAPIKQNHKGEIEKDKSSERRASTPAEEATHFTDTFDLHLLHLNQNLNYQPADPKEQLIITA
jgi:hypothetical protein